jgi:hypothetical protein
MEKFSARAFFLMGELLERIRLEYAPSIVKDPDLKPVLPLRERPDDIVPIGEIPGLKSLILEVRKRCEDIGLKLSSEFAQELHDELDESPTNRRFAEQLGHLADLIKLEMRMALFFYVPPDQAEFYGKPELLGKGVIDKFPQLTEDIVDAGKCLAFGRATAAVFHLMRIMEFGTQKFGAKLSVTFPTNKNWQVILNEADKAIRGLNQKSVRTKRLAAVSAHLYTVKLAWRNEVMHPKQTYTIDEAKEIFGAVKGFMHCLVGVV